MLCEICHKAEANVVVKRKNKDGVETELFVCKRCAAAQSGKKTHEKSAPSKPEFSFPEGDEEPPPFVKNLVEATIGFMNGVVNDAAKKSRKCPVCGLTWEKAKKESRLGCANCWKTFAKSIREEWLHGQYARRHVGASPECANAERSRSFLEREIKRAVKAENYKRAAELRRRLDALEDKGDMPHGGAK